MIEPQEVFMLGQSLTDLCVKLRSSMQKLQTGDRPLDLGDVSSHQEHSRYPES